MQPLNAIAYLFLILHAKRLTSFPIMSVQEPRICTGTSTSAVSGVLRLSSALSWVSNIVTGTGAKFLRIDMDRTNGTAPERVKDVDIRC